MNTYTSQRRFELDWIRIMAILVVFLYHSTRFFNLSNWHVKNINTYIWVEMWISFANLWMMPLFFIISGASLFFVLSKKSSLKKSASEGQLLGDRKSSYGSAFRLFEPSGNVEIIHEVGEIRKKRALRSKKLKKEIRKLERLSVEQKEQQYIFVQELKQQIRATN